MNLVLLGHLLHRIFWLLAAVRTVTKLLKRKISVDHRKLNIIRKSFRSIYFLRLSNTVVTSSFIRVYILNNNAADGFLEPESATLSQLSSVVTNDNN